MFFKNILKKKSLLDPASINNDINIDSNYVDFNNCASSVYFGIEESLRIVDTLNKWNKPADKSMVDMIEYIWNNNEV